MSRRFTSFWRCKGLADGCVTLADVAAALEAEAANVRQMAKDGVKLDEEVIDDYAELVFPDRRQAQRYAAGGV